MWPNSQETVDLVTFIEEILNGKLHFLCSEWFVIRENSFHIKRNEWVLEQKPDQYLQTEMEFKPEVKNYKLQFLFLFVRHDQTIPWKF